MADEKERIGLDLGMGLPPSPKKEQADSSEPPALLPTQSKQTLLNR